MIFINRIQSDKINSFCNCEYVITISGRTVKVKSCFKHKSETEKHLSNSKSKFQQRLNEVMEQQKQAKEQ